MRHDKNSLYGKSQNLLDDICDFNCLITVLRYSPFDDGNIPKGAWEGTFSMLEKIGKQIYWGVSEINDEIENRDG